MMQKTATIPPAASSSPANGTNVQPPAPATTAQTQAAVQVISPWTHAWIQELKDGSAALSSAATVIALVAAVIWFFRRRQRHPRANIQHEIQHWQTGERYILHVRAKVSNVGIVGIKARSMFTRVQQLVPVDPDIEAKLAANVDPVQSGQSEILWPKFEPRECNWKKGERVIEPGETDECHFDFVIPSSAKLVQVYTYLRNRASWWRPDDKHEIGWHARTVYHLTPGGLVGERTEEAGDDAGASPKGAAGGEAAQKEAESIAMSGGTKLITEQMPTGIENGDRLIEQTRPAPDPPPVKPPTPPPSREKK
jgi:hypothetical protein